MKSETMSNTNCLFINQDGLTEGKKCTGPEVSIQTGLFSEAEEWLAHDPFLISSWYFVLS